MFNGTGMSNFNGGQNPAPNQAQYQPMYPIQPSQPYQGRLQGSLEPAIVGTTLKGEAYLQWVEDNYNSITVADINENHYAQLMQIFCERNAIVYAIFQEKPKIFKDFLARIDTDSFKPITQRAMEFLIQHDVVNQYLLSKS